MTNKMTDPTQVFLDPKEKVLEDRAGDVSYTVREVTYDPTEDFRLVPQSQLDEVIYQTNTYQVIVTADPHFGLYVIKYTHGKVPQELSGKYTSRDQAERAFNRYQQTKIKKTKSK